MPGGDVLELLVQRDDDGLHLCAPDVGLFTRALPSGAALAPGQEAGVLLRLGRAARLVVPAGAAGLVTAAPPARRAAPVGYGDVLYTLADLEGALGQAAADTSDDGGDGALVLPAPQAGRFYHRPSPGADAFANVGDVLEPGRPVGLIEVMKTFAHVTWPGSAQKSHLPDRARVLRFVAGDGADVAQGDALLEVEEA